MDLLQTVILLLAFSATLGGLFTFAALAMLYAFGPAPVRSEPQTQPCRPPVPGTEYRITPIEVVDSLPRQVDADGYELVSSPEITIIKNRIARPVPTSRTKNLILEIN